MYIYIFEDGEIKKTTTCDAVDKESCDAGVLDIVDISGPEPKMYYDGEWRDIQNVDA